MLFVLKPENPKYDCVLVATFFAQSFHVRASFSHQWKLHLEIFVDPLVTRSSTNHHGVRILRFPKKRVKRKTTFRHIKIGARLRPPQRKCTTNHLRILNEGTTIHFQSPTFTLEEKHPFEQKKWARSPTPQPTSSPLFPHSSLRVPRSRNTVGICPTAPHNRCVHPLGTFR